MAKLLCFDLETSGIDPLKDRIIELAYVLWDTDYHKPLLIKSDLLIHPEYPPITDEITKLTGIDRPMLDKYGVHPHGILNDLVRLLTYQEVTYIVGHNGYSFDFPFLEKELERNEINPAIFKNWPKLDTRIDLPYPDHMDQSRKLKHLAGEHEFVPLFPHRALFDVLSMVKILDQYDFKEILAYKEIPWVTVRALVSFDNKELAKARKYSWEKIGDKTYPKCWVKMIKENEFEKEKKEACFEITKLV